MTAKPSRAASRAVVQPAALLLARAGGPDPCDPVRAATGLAIVREHLKRTDPPRPYWLIRQQSRRAATPALAEWAETLQATFGGHIASFRARLFGAAALRPTAPLDWTPVHDALRAILARLPEAAEPGFEAFVDISFGGDRLKTAVLVLRKTGSYRRYLPDRSAAAALLRAIETYAPLARDWFSGFGAAGIRLVFAGPMSAHSRAAALKDAARHVAPAVPARKEPSDPTARVAGMLLDGMADRLRQTAAATGVKPGDLARHLARGFDAIAGKRRAGPRTRPSG